VDLVETAQADKWDAKRTEIYSFDAPPRLPEKLVARGVPPEKIDIVINTHLHFDHCGWNTRMVDGDSLPVFTTRNISVQRGELEHAKDPSDRDRASYFPENYAPMEKITPMVIARGRRRGDSRRRTHPRAGHNRDMMCVRLSGGGKTVFFTADLIPTAAHLPYPWIMGYDLYPLTTLETKEMDSPGGARRMACDFGHEPATPAGYLRDQGGKYILEPVVLDF